MAVGDFNNDNKTDVVIPNNGNNSVSILFGYENGCRTSQVTFPTGIGPISVEIGDFNKDNITDLVITNIGNNTNEVMGEKILLS